MKRLGSQERSIGSLLAWVALAAGILCLVGGVARLANAASPAASASPGLASPADVKPPEGPTTKLKIRVVDPDGKPVGNASVYVRFYQSGGFLRHEKLAELDLKTNQDGSVKLPPVPRGKVLIQVIAKGWHTFGKWYDLKKAKQSIEIKLKQPPHWY